MPETIDIYAESIEDVTPINHDSLSITLAGVDLGQLIMEIGQEDILSEIGTKAIHEYLDLMTEDEDGENHE